MKLAELQQHWNQWGKDDPLWAILSNPEKRYNRWNLEEFFKSGRNEIARIMSEVHSLNFSLQTLRALDFGCGVGRLTQALCEIFAECYGVDIAPSMVDLANQYNRYGQRCRYVVNDVDDLSLFPQRFFDFVYCNIVLQHMRPEYSTKYMGEFVRVLNSGGLAVFQVPSHRVEDDPEYESDAGPMVDGSFLAEITAQDQAVTAMPGSEKTFRVRVRNISTVDWPHFVTQSGMYELKLGNHWQDAAGGLIALDDQRVKLPSELKSGEAVDLDMRIPMPTHPARYRLVFDVVQEGVTWFEQRGTEAEIVLVTVTSPAIDAGPGDVPAEGITGGGAAASAPPAGNTVPSSTPAAENAGEIGTSPAPDLVPQPLSSTAAVPPSSDSEASFFVPKIEMYGVPRDTVLEVVQQAGGKPINVLRDFSAGGWVSFRYFVTR